MKYLEAGKNQTEYYDNNGNASNIAERKLLETEYLLRTSRERTKELDKEIPIGERDKRVAAGVVSQKFQKFQSWTGRKYVNPNTIFWNGMLHKCKALEEKQGYLETEDFINIVRLYDLSDISSEKLKGLYKQVYNK